MMGATARKPEGRRALELPHRLEHERSVARAMREPVTLSDHRRALARALADEAVQRLHRGGVEWEPGEGGSHLGTPRWTDAFRRYVTGTDCDTTADGDWVWPLRSSVFRLSISRSGTDRLAARYVWLLAHHRMGVREAWAAQCGRLADPAIADAAEAWAMEALRRWWRRYVELPTGRLD